LVNDDDIRTMIDTIEDHGATANQDTAQYILSLAQQQQIANSYGLVDSSSDLEDDDDNDYDVLE
jgi:hypothetical protein